MALGHNRTLWWHTATLQATIMNIMKPKGKKAISPEELHPCLDKPPPPKLSGKGLVALKYIFCPEQVQKEEAEAAKKKP